MEESGQEEAQAFIGNLQDLRLSRRLVVGRREGRCQNKGDKGLNHHLLDYVYRKKSKFKILATSTGNFDTMPLAN